MSMHWVVVADEARARIFTAGPLLDDLVENVDLVHYEGRVPDRELRSDRPGRFASGNRRSAADPQTTAEEVEADRFARDVATMLREGLNARRYERLVIVAAPRFLGVLRQLLDREVARHVIGEIAKELTKADPATITESVHRYLPETAGMP